MRSADTLSIISDGKSRPEPYIMERNTHRHTHALTVVLLRGIRIHVEIQPSEIIRAVALGAGRPRETRQRPHHLGQHYKHDPVDAWPSLAGNFFLESLSHAQLNQNLITAHSVFTASFCGSQPWTQSLTTKVVKTQVPNV